MSKIKNYSILALTVLIALAFLAAGSAKVLGQEAMVLAFSSFGLPEWFRIAIGILEIVGALLLVIPAFSGMASFGLSIIMIGALACHTMHDPITKAIPALVFFMMLTYIYFVRKNVVPKVLQKYLIGNT